MVSPALPAASPARAWDLPASVVLPGALGAAVLISTQYLFQPFVWRHFPMDEILLGWLDVMGDRAVTALAIGLALLAANRMAERASRRVQVALVCAAIAFGAAVGELVPLAADNRIGPQDVHLALGRVLQWTLVGCSIAAMHHLWRRSVDVRAAVQAEELRTSQIERQLSEMRLQLLRSRIEPHFLFNTLATVRRLHHTDPVQGARLLAHFLSYLRSTLASEQVQHGTLGQEIDLVHAYLNIAAMRMSGRLTLRWNVPDDLRPCDLPPLTVATLAENAVKHGIAPHAAGGTIEVSAQAIGGVLEVTVADTGAGFSGSGGSGIGLANTRARLATLYGAAGTLTLENNRPAGVVARMRLPLLREGAAR
jgi:signal transduction histidine kinase